MIIKPRRLQKITDEEWRVIPNTNDRYFVSNYGRVKSFAYNKTDGQILSNHIIKGFKTVHLKIEKKARTYYVHKLVAEIWIEKQNNDCNIVSHLDGNIINNHISNLAWHTKDSLMVHHRELRQKRPSSKQTRNTNNSKLKEADIRLLKTMLQRQVTQAKIAELFCISEMQVTRIKRGENWGHVQV
jgi:hypothetical protein